MSQQPNPNPNQRAFTLTGNDIANGFRYVTTAALTIGDQDMRFFEILCDVPSVHNIIAYIVLALNVVLAGSGTILAACMAERYVANKTQLAVGFF